MKKYTFTPETLTACGPNFPEGRTFPARYLIQDAADMKRGQAVPVVHIFALVDEREIKIDVPGDDEWYYEAFKAATEAAEQAETVERVESGELRVESEQPETVEEIETETEQAAEIVEAVTETVEQTETEQAAEIVEAEPVELEQTETEQAAETVEAVTETVEAVETEQAAEIVEAVTETVEAEPVKVERRPAGDKSFIGTAIEGKRYRIVFDSETQRTRVIIPAEYREAARQTVEGAGFYWSKNMESFNKKLTCKAYRAAVALAAELDKTLTA